MHSYQPNLGVIATRSNLASLTDPGQVCLILKATTDKLSSLLPGGLGNALGPLTGQIVSTCTKLIKNSPDLSGLLAGSALQQVAGAAGRRTPADAHRRSRWAGRKQSGRWAGRRKLMMRAKPVVAVLAVAAMLLSGCGFTGLYSAPLPGGPSLGAHPFTVTAYFDDVLDLVPQSEVKVDDVAVGKVTAISLHKWTAKVVMQVNGEVDLPANSTAEIAQTSLLGEKYVSLKTPDQRPQLGEAGRRCGHRHRPHPQRRGRRAGAGRPLAAAERGRPAAGPRDRSGAGHRVEGAGAEGPGSARQAQHLRRRSWTAGRTTSPPPSTTSTRWSSR